MGYWDSSGKWVNDAPSTSGAWSGTTTPEQHGSGLGDNPVDASVKNHPLGSLPNYDTNLEAARRHALAAQAWKPTATAAHAGPVTIDRSFTDPTRTQQLAQLGRYQTMARGGGPSVSDPLTRAALGAALKQASATPRTTGGLGLRASLGAAGMGGGAAAMQGASMKAGEQQQAWGALNNAAFGARGQDLTADIDQAKLSQQIGMANAGMDQSVALGNQNASLAGLANQIAAAQQYGGLVNDAMGADFAYRDHLAGIERYNRSMRDRENELAQQRAAQGVGLVMNVMTAGYGSGAVSSAQQARTANAAKA